MATTIRTRLDRAAKLLKTIQTGADARNATILLNAGASADVDPSQWPTAVLDGLREWGWTAKRAHDLLVRWQNELDKDTLLVIHWMDGETWNGQGDAPLLTIQPGYLDKLRPDAPGDELSPTGDKPDKVTTPYVYTPPQRERRPFPHERQWRPRPRWSTR